MAAGRPVKLFNELDALAMWMNSMPEMDLTNSRTFSIIYNNVHNIYSNKYAYVLLGIAGSDVNSFATKNYNTVLLLKVIY